MRARILHWPVATLSQLIEIIEDQFVLVPLSTANRFEGWTWMVSQWKKFSIWGKLLDAFKEDPIIKKKVVADMDLFTDHKEAKPKMQVFASFELMYNRINTTSNWNTKFRWDDANQVIVELSKGYLDDKKPHMRLPQCSGWRDQANQWMNKMVLSGTELTISNFHKCITQPLALKELVKMIDTPEFAKDLTKEISSQQGLL
jgi:hypothetical protein